MAVQLLHATRRCVAPCCSCIRGAGARRRSSSRPSVSVDVGGSTVKFSAGKFANLADGAVVVECGSTGLMVTAVSERIPKQDSSGLPLIVDYRERASAYGRIPGNFFKRELRPYDYEILASRFIDRSIRSLFPAGYCYNTQVISDLLALDGRHDTEVLSINGASAALSLSDIPWAGPVGAVRVGCCNHSYCINPSLKQLQDSSLNVIVACTEDRIGKQGFPQPKFQTGVAHPSFYMLGETLVMVEGSGLEVTEAQFCEAVMLGFTEAQKFIAAISELSKYRQKPLREITPALPSEELADKMDTFCRDKITAILSDPSHGKASRDEALFSLLDRALEHMALANLLPPTADRSISKAAFWGVCRKVMAANILNHQMRCDGRSIRGLRPIQSEVDIFDALHGSATFRRGETQVFCSVTFDSALAAPREDQLSKVIGAGRSKRFLLHYEFPPFATNVIGRFLQPGRREAGHGALAEKALAPLVPKDFPFTIRVNSQVTDSNGSSSMASVCGGSLALFDAGVPMSKPAAGVACGLFTETSSNCNTIEKYQIITDLSGIEDALGNMDFKVAGTRDGITSMQMDIKDIGGVPFHIFEEALCQARDARCQVLDAMDECQAKPRQDLKENAPAYFVVDVPISKRLKLVGSGGHRIRALSAELGVQITSTGDETMSVFAPSREAMDVAVESISQLLNTDDGSSDSLETQQQVFEAGAILSATVLEVRSYGLMLELSAGEKCLLHISDMAHKFVKDMSEFGLQVGSVISVKYLGRDPKTGRHWVSRKPLLPAPPPPLIRSRGPRPAGDDSRRQKRNTESMADDDDIEEGV